MLRALSMGGGVQTTCLALLAAEGLWQRPDVAIFADTQWEPAAVYQHLDWLAGVLPFPVLRVTAGSLRENLVTRTNTSGSKYAAIPYFTADGIGRRQCTHEYKLKPIHRELRRLLGKGPRDAIKPGTVELWLGISMDEAHRLASATLLSDRSWSGMAVALRPAIAVPQLTTKTCLSPPRPQSR